MGTLVDYKLPCIGCSSSDAMARYQGVERGEHDHYWCFSCHTRFPIKKGQFKHIERSAVDIRLPPLYVPITFPRWVYKWLADRNITEELISAYGIQYTKELRIWSPKYDKHVDVGARILFFFPGGFEARTLDTSDKLKYITYGEKNNLFKSNSVDEIEKLEYIIIVEDMMSAMVVGEVDPCVALLGTSLSKTQEWELTQLAPTYILWFDDDVAGIKARRKLTKRLQWYGKVLYITTPQDPKMYTQTQIENYVAAAVN